MSFINDIKKQRMSHPHLLTPYLLTPTHANWAVLVGFFPVGIQESSPSPLAHLASLVAPLLSLLKTTVSAAPCCPLSPDLPPTSKPLSFFLTPAHRKSLSPPLRIAWWTGVSVSPGDCKSQVEARRGPAALSPSGFLGKEGKSQEVIGPGCSCPSLLANLSLEGFGPSLELYMPVPDTTRSRLPIRLG